MIDLSPEKVCCPHLCAEVYSECHKFELMVLAFGVFEQVLIKFFTQKSAMTYS